MYLMKGIAALAMGLVAASCNKMDFDQNAYQQAKEQESKEKFISNVMNGQEIDPNQTWNTTTACQVKVTPDKSGTLKIYTAYPLGNTVASLYTTNVSAGQPVSFTIAKPMDVSTLYAAVVDDNEMIVALDVINATGDNAEVDMTRGDAVTRGATRRAAQPDVPTFRDVNPIVKPIVPAGLQNTVPADAHYAQDYQNYQKGDVIYVNTAYSTLNNPQNTENLTIYVDGNVTLTCGFKQDGGTKIVVTEKSTLKLGSMGNGIAVYLAPGATLDITEGLTENVISYWPYQSEIVKNGNNTFTFQNANAAIYMASGAILKATDLSLVNGAELLNDGGTITANSVTLDQKCVAWNNGSFTVKSLSLANTGSCFYNAANKTVTAETISSGNNECLIYNDGTVNASGAITLRNSAAEFINTTDATLTCASYSQAAGGKTHNHGTVTMSGKTELTNKNSTWMNDGQWTCGSFDVDNYSDTNFNNCKLTVDGNFHLNRGTFSLAANAGVVCESFTWEDTSDFYLGSNSLLKINGDLHTNNANSNYGFRGTGDDYAVIQAKAITHDGNEQFRMSYYGKLYVATDSHFELWYKDAPNTNQPSYWTDKNVIMCDGQYAAADIQWEETPCRPGYKGKKKDPDPIMYYYYAFEDLGTIGDFDFNDVVLRVSAPVDRNLTVQLCAAGGKLQSQVYYGDQSLGSEVHVAFGINELTGTDADMVNTGGSTSTKNFVTLGTVTVAEDADPANLPFAIEVTGTDGRSTRVTKSVEGNGKAPLMIVVSGYPSGDDTGSWFWATERTNITNAYQEFGAWGANASSNQNWYHNYTDGKVWKY